jgi:hypothetical protein
MTLTIDIPDDVAEQVRTVAQSQGIDLNTFAVEALTSATRTNGESLESLIASRRSVIGFDGVGAGRPGAIVGDVNAHIRSHRDGGDDNGVIVPTNPLRWDEFAALMVEGIDPNQPPLPDYALSRESMYEDRY